MRTNKHSYDDSSEAVPTAAMEAAECLADPQAARLLIVEDDADLAKVLSEHLAEALQLDVSVAGTCRQAVDIELSKPQDLILADLLLPDGDAISLQRQLRGISAASFVLMSGVPTVNRVVEAMRMGALDFMVKPFDLSHMTAIVSDAMVRHQSRCQTAGPLYAVAAPGQANPEGTPRDEKPRGPGLPRPGAGLPQAGQEGRRTVRAVRVSRKQLSRPRPARVAGWQRTYTDTGRTCPLTHPISAPGQRAAAFLRAGAGPVTRSGGSIHRDRQDEQDDRPSATVLGTRRRLPRTRAVPGTTGSLPASAAGPLTSGPYGVRRLRRRFGSEEHAPGFFPLKCHPPPIRHNSRLCNE